MTPEQNILVEAVAAELKWFPAPGYESHWSRVYSMPDGGRLYFSTGRGKCQLHISTSVPDSLRDHRPHYRPGEAPATSINVSDSKPAARMAADIRRRLLPEHEREVAACAAQKAKHDDHNAQRLSALNQVAAPLGAVIRCDDRSGEPQPLAIDREGKFTLKARPFCASLVLEIEAVPAVAGRIAVMLATL